MEFKSFINSSKFYHCHANKAISFVDLNVIYAFEGFLLPDSLLKSIASLLTPKRNLEMLTLPDWLTIFKD